MRSSRSGLARSHATELGAGAGEGRSVPQHEQPMSTHARLSAPAVAGSASRRPSSAARFFRKRRGAITAALSVVVGFVLWELVARFIIRDKLFLVAPSA